MQVSQHRVSWKPGERAIARRACTGSQFEPRDETAGSAGGLECSLGHSPGDMPQGAKYHLVKVAEGV